MNGKHQVTRSIQVATDPAGIWGIVADSTLLPQWARVVTDVTYLGGETEEGVGMTRQCNVELGGRTGTMTERCVEFVPGRRAGYVVDDDTLGFHRMLVDYGFAITLEPRSDRTTALRIDTYYTPRNPLYGLLNQLVLRRRLRRTVDGLLQGLKEISERRGAQAD
jgi:Polyketide cyclase / dehydrase and lipid transport